MYIASQYIFISTSKLSLGTISSDLELEGSMGGEVQRRSTVSFLSEFTIVSVFAKQRMKVQARFTSLSYR